MNAVAGTRRVPLNQAEKPRHFGPCPPKRIFDLPLEPAGRPISIAAFIRRSYYYTIDLAAGDRLAADGEVQPACGSLCRPATPIMALQLPR